ncbi:SCAN domain-containing protein 3-like [Metopolophium dirhodum]|uniref:SCAN domain-containing protein 3-like n=1 Tax=Metopolophium dirhodum TaxID=44670 RepID=UPI00298F8510|nr:SCAN domain-containing protein 3-like [Metopolophium dirhodum]
MTGKHVGVVRRIKEVAPDAEWTHCMLHREALVSKKMSTELNKVLSESVKIYNFIKSGALNGRLFYKLSEENEQNVKSLLLHSELFPKDIRDDFQWIENPFTVSIEEMNFNTLLETQIIELSCDKTYENKFKNETLVDFWCAVYNEYPELSINAIKKLLLFPTTYLCEKGFSTMANIKTKHRNRLDVTHDMRISLRIQNQNSH